MGKTAILNILNFLQIQHIMIQIKVTLTAKVFKLYTSSEIHTYTRDKHTYTENYF